MISILIPTYNYDIFPLAKKVHDLVSSQKIDFEIICIDDCSSNLEFIKKNEQINTLENSTYQILKKNIGRSSIRNLLAEKANFNWLLFLDADTMPINNNFILNYLKVISKNYEIVYGGIQYLPHRPHKSQLLRWHYGNIREALPVDERLKKPYLSFLTLNFLIKKSVFDKVKFNESIPNLRHEDTLFSFELKKAEVSILHIDNAVYHLGIESSQEFLKKSLESVEGALYLRNNQLIETDYIKILSFYERLKKLKINKALMLLPKGILYQIEKNLLSEQPSLKLFDFYRLHYLMRFERNA
ncbi:glycosyltransferase family 2 protein [Mesonia sp.]|uniref:glycosyltransferase family 2 protein n=1 Tax=Mesonia sp. TaxID=1960830 RepID=UPI0017784C1D|nr:glycosyltransferase family 2 protein [Mesonia sp.]HIB36095.1 glycosyltransferase family 2 protein [Mesonia sp.]HIO26578.1 glycosyltransferase family 2 protein [Flavobacteriaceae bacterium]